MAQATFLADAPGSTLPPTSGTTPVDLKSVAAASGTKDAGLNISSQDVANSRYKEEREKRLRGDGVQQFREAAGELSAFQDDVWAAPLTRAPIVARTKVVIVGGGFGGLVTAVKLKQAGIEDFVIVERGGDFGGTWYFNRYPGVTCDVESLIYLPLLEETGYIPKDRFSYGPEIRDHIERIVKKWDLRTKAWLQTDITSVVWDDAMLRWQIRTNREDHWTAQHVVIATGTLHKPKLPGIKGIEKFQNVHFHSGRFDYKVTGGSGNGSLVGLKTKTVGIIGTGASGVQLVPRIAEDAKHLYVFQRTPSTVTPRENWTNNPKQTDRFHAGWQEEERDLFANLMQGERIDRACTALEGLEALTMKTITEDAEANGVEVTPEKFSELYKAADFKLMEKLRRYVEESVRDTEVAAKLKPWFVKTVRFFHLELTYPLGTLSCANALHSTMSSTQPSIFPTSR